MWSGLVDKYIYVQFMKSQWQIFQVLSLPLILLYFTLNCELVLLRRFLVKQYFQVLHVLLEVSP